MAVELDTGGLIQKLGRFLAPISNKVPGILCRNHSKLFIDALNSSVPWAEKMWDSSARVQSGLVTGNLNSLGNFDECTSVNVLTVQNGSTLFTGQYCLPTFALRNISASDALGQTLKHVMEEEEEINVGLGALLSKGLRWGICMPSSCSSEDLMVGLTRHLGTKSGVEVSVEDPDCTVDQDTPFSFLDWITLVVLLLLLLLVFLSTGYELITGYLWKSGYFSADQEESEQEPDVPSRTVTANETLPLLPPAPSAPPIVREQPKPNVLEPPKKPSILDLVARERRQSENGSRQSSRGSSRRSSPSKDGNGIKHRNKLILGSNSEDEGFDRLPSSIQHILRQQAFRQQPFYQQPIQREQLLAEEARQRARGPNYELDYLASFSLVSNAKEMCNFKYRDMELLSLYGIKFLSVCWVLMGHAYLVIDSMPAMNYVSIKNFTNRWEAMLILNAELAADTFMVVTGLLITHNVLSDLRLRGIYYRHGTTLERTGMTPDFLPKYIPKYYLHRYMRLTPALALMVLFEISLMNHLGSGPFWNSGRKHPTEVCEESWWGTLLYVQNFVNPEKICVPHSWYYMVDMQLYLLTPFIFLYMLAWSVKRSVRISGILVFIGVLSTFLVNFLMKVPAGILIADPSERQRKENYDTVSAHTRLAPMVIGMTTGYFLHCYKFGEMWISTLEKWVCTGWTAAILLVGYALFGELLFHQPDYMYESFLSALYSSTKHAAWALGVAWIILTCETNYGGILQRVLSCKIFRPLSRLTYCIFLVHLPVLIIRSLMTRVPIYVNEINMISAFLGYLLLSSLLALVLFFCVEMPFIRLHRTLSVKYGYCVKCIPSHNARTVTRVSPVPDRRNRFNNGNRIPVHRLVPEQQSQLAPQPPKQPQQSVPQPPSRKPTLQPQKRASKEQYTQLPERQPSQEHQLQHSKQEPDPNKSPPEVPPRVLEKELNSQNLEVKVDVHEQPRDVV